MIRQSILNAIFPLALCICAAPAQAEMQVIRWGDRAEWNAVGTLNKRGIAALSSCTGTLIAPDLVLTAAHCVPTYDPPAEVLEPYVFVAGWNRGEYATAVGIRAVYLHPDHAPGRLSLANAHTDAALVRLAAPIPSEVVTPMALGVMPKLDVPLALIGYGNHRRHAPEFMYNCAQTDQLPLLSMIDCNVHGGQSGSPLMVLGDDGPRVVGVISAKIRGGAMAARLQDWMRAYITLP